MFDFVFCKYFLPVYILPSHSLDVSFEEQKCWISVKSSLSFISIMDHVFPIVFKKYISILKVIQVFFFVLWVLNFAFYI